MKNAQESGVGLQYIGGLHYQDSVTVVIKGDELKLVRILTIFTTIDLSDNNFEGDIPDIIGSLDSLLVLNLSHNSLVGQIPSSLGNLLVLESLDLSSNQHVGEIPVILTDLTFLEALNLSHNHLVGLIPQGGQFDTFQNDSYSRNLALCGFPLSKNCGNDKEPQTPPSVLLQENNSDFFSGFNWKSVLMGYSYGTILGLIMGYLMLLTEKPKWFTGIVGRQRRRNRQRLRSGNRHGARRI
ncbi:unnamed protein product [Ilex paraguariensis]|uniref:Receptor-like protein 12 n=1 Tax=Ilex paraguariensis TaxID=185542 RepID=A0ABC8TAV7_9AQUA